MSNDLHDYALRIDGPLFRCQRQRLIELTNTAAKEDQELLEGIIALMEEIADQAHDNYGIDCLLVPGEPDNPSCCECELPGYFCSGVPGILAHLENGRLADGAEVERCGLCCRYPSDAAALEKLRELGFANF